MAQQAQAVSFRWADRGGSFIQALSGLRAKDAYCDATIICEDHYHNVHQLVLSTSSDYLAHLFDKAASWRPSGSTYPIIALPGISHKCLEAILNYIYTGQTTVNVDDLEELRKAASMLQITDFAGFVPDSTMKLKNKRSMEKESSYSARKKQRFERSDNFDPVFNRYCEIPKSAGSVTANIQEDVSEDGPKSVIVGTKVLECDRAGEGTHLLESNRSSTEEGEARSFLDHETEEDYSSALRKTINIKQEIKDHYNEDRVTFKIITSSAANTGNEMVQTSENELFSLASEVLGDNSTIHINNPDLATDTDTQPICDDVNMQAMNVPASIAISNEPSDTVMKNMVIGGAVKLEGKTLYGHPVYEHEPRDFYILCEGSAKGEDLLVDSLDYVYNPKSPKGPTRTWKCRSRGACTQSIYQIGDVFTMNRKSYHKCKVIPGTRYGLLVIKESKRRGLEHPTIGALDIVKQVVNEILPEDVSLPFQLESIARSVTRYCEANGVHRSVFRKAMKK